MVESQGKVSEKSGNFEMDIEWQPCPYVHSLRCVNSWLLLAINKGLEISPKSGGKSMNFGMDIE